MLPGSSTRRLRYTEMASSPESSQHGQLCDDGVGIDDTIRGPHVKHLPYCMGSYKVSCCSDLCREHESICKQRKHTWHVVHSGTRLLRW
eukprot:6869501-Pyramimonas_sp.AAC.1